MVGLLWAGPADAQFFVRSLCSSITNPQLGWTCSETSTLTLKQYNGSAFVPTGASAGVGSINSLTGTLTIAGTASQVNVVSGGTTITLSLPQSIATTSSVGFGNVAVNALGRVDLFNGAGSFRSSLQAPSALSESYTLTWPTSVSGVANGSCFLAGTFAAGVLPVTIAPCPGGGGGGNITSIGGQVGPVITAGANDANITLTWAGNVVTPGWTGTLSPARGGLGGNFGAATGLLFDTAGTITATLTPGGLTSVAIGAAAPSAGAIFEAKGAGAVNFALVPGMAIMYQGSTPSPQLTAGATLIVTRQENIATLGTESAAILAKTAGFGAAQAQAGFFFADSYGVGDALGVFGLGINRNGTGTGFGGYFEARANAPTSHAVAIQTTTQNNTGVNHSWDPSVFPSTVGFDIDYIGGAGLNTGGAAMMLRAGGAGQWDCGLCTSLIGSGGPIKTVFIRDDSGAVTSIDLRGTHTTGISLSLATISGNALQSTGFFVTGVGRVFGTLGTFGGSVAPSFEPLEVQGALAGLSLYDRTNGATQRWVVYADQFAGATNWRIYSLQSNVDVLHLTRFGVLTIGQNLTTLPTPPTGSVLQASAGAASSSYLTAEAFGGQGGFIGRRANGTPGARSALLTDQPIAAYTARGAFDATNYSSDQASVGFFAGANWAAGNTPTYITFGVTPIGLTTLIESMRIAGISGGPGYRVSLSPVLPSPSFNNSRPFSILATTTGTRVNSGGGFVTGNTVSGLYVQNTDSSQSVSMSLGDRTSVTAMVRAIEQAGFTGTAYGTALVYESAGNAAERGAMLAAMFVGAGSTGTFYGVNGFLGIPASAGTLVTPSVIGLFELNCQVASCLTYAHGVLAQNLSGPFGAPTTAASAFTAFAVTGGGVEAWVDFLRLTTSGDYGTAGIRYRVRNDGSMLINVPAGYVGHVISSGINNVETYSVSENGDIGSNSVTIRSLSGGGNRTACVNNAGVVYTVASGAAC